MEEQQITRFFVPEGDDSIIRAWLPSLDITCIRCNSLKELFEALANRLLMLAVSDEAGIYLESDRQKTEQYRVLLEQLNTNRMEQNK